jgi:cytochrome c peroxidase
MFWDGRAGSLEEQALGPIGSPGEMNQPPATLVAKLSAIPGYAALFEEAYPGEGISTKTLGKAISTYERTLVSAEAPFDRWVKGDEAAISGAAKHGFVVFNERGQCAKCHSGWRFTDDGFHDIGVADDDLGRGKILPDIEVLQHAFKTPTLRNVDRRAPYLHCGTEPTLASVIELYDQGGQVRRPSLAEQIRPLGLSAEDKSDLVAFLRTLTSPDAPTVIPTLPR